MTVFEDEVMKLEVERSIPSFNWLVKRSVTTLEIRTYFERVAHFYDESKKALPELSNALLDARRSVPRELSDFKLYLDEYLPKLAAAGLQKVAIVMPDNEYAQATYEGFLGRNGHMQVQHELFMTTLHAKDWLRRK